MCMTMHCSTCRCITIFEMLERICGSLMGWKHELDVVLEDLLHVALSGLDYCERYKSWTFDSKIGEKMLFKLEITNFILKFT